MTRQFFLGYLSQFGVFAWVLLIGGIALAFWKLKRWHTRTLAVVIILGLFAAYPGRWAFEVQQKKDAAIDHYKAGEALFNERCKTVAGYKIHKVVEDVEGIQLLKIRHRINEADPMAPGAAFALERVDHEYISQFIMYRYPSSGTSDGSYFINSNKTDDAISGFRYVDVIDEKDGKRYRHAGRWEDVWEETWEKSKVYVNGGARVFFGLVPDSEPVPRYAVTFEDHVVPEERQYGIASSAIKVIDTQTNEVLAEMLRYAWSPGRPSAANPSPWLTARKCPGFGHGGSAATRQFVDHVLVARGATLPSQLPHR